MGMNLYAPMMNVEKQESSFVTVHSGKQRRELVHQSSEFSLVLHSLTWCPHFDDTVKCQLLSEIFASGTTTATS